jgi:DNA ligase-1
MNQLALFPTPPAPSWSGGPMLLDRWFPGALAFPFWAERKVNGVRCLIHVAPDGSARAWSREGRPLRAAQPLADRIAKAAGPGVYDCELAGETFRRTLSAVKRGSPAGLALWAFDCLTVEEWRAGRSGVPLEARQGRLEALRGVPGVELVQAALIRDAGELDAHFLAALAAGWEGLALKAPGSGYTCGERGRSWCKMKPGKGEPCA